MSRTIKVISAASSLALMFSLFGKTYAEVADSSVAAEAEGVVMGEPGDQSPPGSPGVELAEPLQEPIRISGFEPPPVPTPPTPPSPPPVPLSPSASEPDHTPLADAPGRAGLVGMAPRPDYRPEAQSMPMAPARNWSQMSAWSPGNQVPSFARDTLKGTMTAPLTGAIPNMDRHRGLGGVMALPESSMPSFNIPGFMRVWKMDLTDPQRKSLKEVYKGLRRINHSLSGELMDAVDAIQELYEIPQPEPKSVGKAYGRYFDIQRRWIEAQIAAANRVDDLATDVLNNPPTLNEIPVPDHAMDLHLKKPSAPLDRADAQDAD